jgi:RNA polymerase sigma factor (sigma-70 family)
MDKYFTRLTLIQKLQDDCDEKIWDEFISLYKGYVFMIVKRIGFNDEDCNDIMQIIFFKIWKNVEGFKRGERNGSFRRWLAVISNNTAKDFLKKNIRECEKRDNLKVQNQISHLSNISEPEIEVMAEKEWALYISNKAWDNIKDNLNDNLKNCFNMILDGKDRQEISEKINMPPNTVSVYKRRVTAMLQKEISRLQETFG